MKATLQRAGQSIAGAMWMAFLTITFQRAEQLMPERPRMGSPGLIAMVSIGTVLMLARQVLVTGGSPTAALVGWGLVLLPMAIGSGTRLTAYLSMLIAASVGADSAALVTFLTGVADFQQGPARGLFAIWELSAGGVACIRMASAPRAVEQ